MNAPVDDEHKIEIGDYVEVVNTNDEFEDLIGVVEDFYDSEGKSCQSDRKEALCVIRIPLQRQDQAMMRLVGVNFITPYVRHELKTNEELCLFTKDKLEWFDPNEL